MREARAGDVASIAALATLVFLDTYAPDGLRPDLAREAFSGYSATAFEGRLRDQRTRFLLAESAGHLVGFVEMAGAHSGPAVVAAYVEVVRLYVHPRFQQRGIGKALLARAEQLARDGARRESGCRPGPATRVRLRSTPPLATRSSE